VAEPARTLTPQTERRRFSARLRPVEKRALVKTARLLKSSQNGTVTLAIIHLSETLANGLPVYVSLPPHTVPR